MKVNLWK